MIVLGLILLIIGLLVAGLHMLFVIGLVLLIIELSWPCSEQPAVRWVGAGTVPSVWLSSLFRDAAGRPGRTARGTAAVPR